MGIFDSLPKPPKHNYTIDWSNVDIEKSAKEFEKLEITPEAKAQFLKEKAMGYHIGNR